MVFLLRSEFFFRTTWELEYYFFLSHKTRIFFPELNIRLYDKNSESDYFFLLHQNRKKNFSNIGNYNIFLEKNHNPPWKLNGPSLISCWKDKQSISVLWLDWFEQRLKLDKKNICYLHYLCMLSLHMMPHQVHLL
jgi:hypothetical protein